MPKLVGVVNIQGSLVLVLQIGRYAEVFIDQVTSTI